MKDSCRPPQKRLWLRCEVNFPSFLPRRMAIPALGTDGVSPQDPRYCRNGGSSASMDLICWLAAPAPKSLNATSVSFNKCAWNLARKRAYQGWLYDQQRTPVKAGH